MIYLTCEGDKVNNIGTITCLLDLARGTAYVQCPVCAWYFSLLLLLPQLLPVLHLHVECGEAGGGVRLLPALVGGRDVLLPVVAGGGLVPLPAVGAGNGHVPLLALAGGGDVLM